MQSDLSFEPDLTGLTRAELFVLAGRVEARLHESEHDESEDTVAPPDKVVPQATPATYSLPQLEGDFDLTERPRQESFYKAILDSLDEGIVVRDLDGDLIYSNAQSWRGVSGDVPQDLEELAASISRINPLNEDGSPSTTHLVLDELLTSLNTPAKGRVSGYQAEAGETTWVSLNVAPLLAGEESEPYAYVQAYTNITALKEREDELRRQEQFYRGIIRTLDETIVVRDLEGRLLFANIRPWSTLREAAPIDLKGAMTEFSRSEIVDENGTRILNNQDADEVLEFLSSPVEGKVIAVKPKEAESKKKWLSLNIASLDSDQGEPTAYVIATTNITALKEKEAELRRQESFYKSIIDALDETITVRDSEGRVVFANGGAWTTGDVEDLARLATVICRSDVVEEDGTRSALVGCAEELLRSIENGSSVDVRRCETELWNHISAPTTGKIRGYLTQEGGRTWYSANTKPLTIEGESHQDGFVKALSNVTVLKEREQALLEEQDRLRNILNNMSVMLLAMDDVGKVLF